MARSPRQHRVRVERGKRWTCKALESCRDPGAIIESERAVEEQARGSHIELPDGYRVGAVQVAAVSTVRDRKLGRRENSVQPGKLHSHYVARPGECLEERPIELLSVQTACKLGEGRRRGIHTLDRLAPRWPVGRVRIKRFGSHRTAERHPRSIWRQLDRLALAGDYAREQSASTREAYLPRVCLFVEPRLRGRFFSDQERASEGCFDALDAREHVGREAAKGAKREQRAVDDARAEGCTPREVGIEMQRIPVAARLGEGKKVLLRERGLFP